MFYADLPEVRIRYHWDGPAKKPVLLLSNSLGTNLDMWRYQVDALKNDFRILRYDTRGQGGSEVPRRPYTIERMGKDVIALLDHLNIEKVSFCGLSLGGSIGMSIAIHHPERLKSLVIANTAAKLGTEESWDARVLTIRKGGLESIVKQSPARWFTPEFQAKSPTQVNWIQQMVAISGRHDEVTPLSDGKYLQSHIPGSQDRVLEAAHLSIVERSAEFSICVKDFLK